MCLILFSNEVVQEGKQELNKSKTDFKVSFFLKKSLWFSKDNFRIHIRTYVSLWLEAFKLLGEQDKMKVLGRRQQLLWMTVMRVSSCLVLLVYISVFLISSASAATPGSSTGISVSRSKSSAPEVYRSAKSEIYFYKFF